MTLPGMERWASQVASKQHLPSQTNGTSSSIDQAASSECQNRQIPEQAQHLQSGQEYEAREQLHHMRTGQPLQRGFPSLQQQSIPSVQVAGVSNTVGTSGSSADLTHIQLTEINGRWMVPVATTADGFNWDVSFQELDVSTTKYCFFF